MMDVPWTLTTKVAFIASQFLLTLVFALMPMLVIKGHHTERDPRKRSQYSRLIGLLNCFAGGVFLATALLHLLPNVEGLLAQFSMESKFPIAEFAVTFGFLVVLVTEQTGLACQEQDDDTLDPVQRLNQPFPVISSPGSEDVLVSGEIRLRPMEPPPTSHLRTILLLAVLCVHALFDGLTVSLQTNMAAVFNVFIAIMLHKVIVAFSVGLKLLQSELHVASVLALDVLFSTMSPVGMCLGLFLEMCGTCPHQQLLSGLLQGIACGSFLYITCFEVLPKQLSNGQDRLLKLLTLLIGVSSSVGVLFINSI